MTSIRSSIKEFCRWSLVRMYCATCIVLSLLAGIASAQQDITVTLTVQPPYSPNLDVWMSNPNRILITLLNTNPTKTYDIRLAGSAKNLDGSLSMETKNEVPATPIRLEPLRPRQLNLNDFRIFDANSVRFKGTNTQIIARTHLLPDGIYTICVQALDIKTLQPLSAERCQNIEIKNADAPLLLRPDNSSRLDPVKDQMMQFQWIPPTGASVNSYYEFSIIENPQKMESEALFRTPGAGREVFKREVRGASVLTLPARELKLEDGKKYGWRVRIIDPTNATAYKNEGYSPAWSFDFAGDLVAKPPKLKMPDTLVAAGFEIVVQSWDEKSRSLDKTLPSGKGCVKFDCTKKKKVIPPWWKDLVLKPVEFDVIGAKIDDSSSQLHISEAQLIDLGAKIGDKMMLDLPSTGAASKLGTIIDRTKLVDFFKKTIPAGCIMVAFHDVKWDPPSKPKVMLTAGEAYYPTNPATPMPPALLALDSNFTLAIDSLVITTTQATVQGKVYLPSNIISADTCTRAFVKLPKTTITSNCEFYQEVVTQDSGFGRWWIGNTGFQVLGGRYVVDFSSTQSPSGYSPSLTNTWKGIALLEGKNVSEQTATVTSNRGYNKAPFTFSNAKITDDGFEAALIKSGGFWSYDALEPYGYTIFLQGGRVFFGASTVVGGSFKSGSISMPLMAIRKADGSRISATYDSLVIQPDMDLFGSVSMELASYTWGEFSRTTGRPKFYFLDRPSSKDTGSFYLSAKQIKPYYPADSVWHHPNLFNPALQLEAQGIQGVTLASVKERTFIIYTPDVPSPTAKELKFPKETIVGGWMNVIRSGVHMTLGIACDSAKLANKLLGDSLRSPYFGERSFNTDFGVCFDKRGTTDKPPTTTHVPTNTPKSIMPFQFCESAVWNSELAGQVHLAAPSSISVAFKNMMFTSTADCAGGQVDLSQPDTLPYWGVAFVAKDPTKSAGIVCARLGVIYLTAAGLSEPRHYSKPFWMTWAELKADGNMGRFFFDYNNVGQKFDGFPFSASYIRLSDYDPVLKDTAWIPPGSGSGAMNLGPLSGFLHTYGMVSVHFFGGKNLSISDYKLDNNTPPYGGRWVRVQKEVIYEAPKSDMHWQRTWCEGIAEFDYTNISYDSMAQDGFYGTGTASLLEITGDIASSITIRADHSCFSLTAETSHDVNLKVFANITSMASIWGCGCIFGETLDKIVIGGQVSSGAGVGSGFVARTGSTLSMKMGLFPTQTRLSIQGDMYVLLASTINAEVSGMAELVEDHSEMYVEGYLKGTVSMSTHLTAMRAEGELQWHIGLNYQMIQGRVAVGIFGPLQTGMESGFFLGNNCPKDKIWVTNGINSRFAFNKNALPASLSGVYFFLSVSQSINLYVVSGGYEVYTGIGMFHGTSPPVASGFGLIGNVGVRIWGEILGGLVSASAWGNLQMIIGVPPAFQGSLGLEACVLWVFCGSVTVHCGYNVNDGFYIY